MKPKQVVDLSEDPITMRFAQGTDSPEEVPKADISRAQRLAFKQAEAPVERPPARTLAEPAPISPTPGLGVTPQPTREPAESEWDWGEILIGATPVLAGLVMGEPDIGFTAGGAGLIQRQKELMDLNKEQIKALKGKGKPTRMMRDKYIDDSGNTRLGWADPTTGERFYAPDDPLAGTAAMSPEMFAQRKEIAKKSELEKYEEKGQQFTYKNLPDGRLAAIDKRTQEVTMIGDTSGMAPNARKDAVKYVADYNKSVSKDIAGFTDLEGAFRNLIDNNQLGNKLAVMRFVKEVETRLSDYDRVYYTGEISELRQLSTKAREIKSNTLNPRLVKETMKLTARALNKIKKRVADNRKLRMSQLKGVRPELTEDQLGKAFGIMPDFDQGPAMKKDDDLRMVPWDMVPEAIDRGYKVVK